MILRKYDLSLFFVQILINAAKLSASLQKCVFDETICAELDAHEKVTKANFFAGPSPLSHFKKFSIGLIVTLMIVTLVIVTPW